MVNIILLVGPPGSGKSTFANALVKESNVVKVSRDDIRFSLKQVWFSAQNIEDVVSSIQDATIKSLIDKGYDIIVDNTHCKIAYIKEFIKKFGKNTNISLKIIGSELSIDDLIERNIHRDKPVPEEVIRNMYKGFRYVLSHTEEIRELIKETLEGPKSIKTVFQDPLLPRAIIVDIDGTVAHMNGKRGPYDWKKVGVDDPDVNVLNIVRALSKTYKVFFVSGRDESCRMETIEWLNKHYGYRTYILYMRPKGNFEKDSIIKERIFKNHFYDKYYVEMLFDDRQQVVDQYRTMGLKVAQVAEGNF